MDTANPKIKMEYRRCGKTRCKCFNRDHPGHGPYFYRLVPSGGKTKREYLGGPFGRRTG